MRVLWLCGALLAASCGRNDPPETKAPPETVEAKERAIIEISPGSAKLAQIRVVEAKLEELPVDEFTAPGKLEANPNRLAKVLLPAPGRVADVLVHFGDAVERNQPVAEVESPEADEVEGDYLQAGAAVTKATADLAKAQADYERATDLFKGDAIAKKEVLNAENAVAQAKSALEQSQAARQQSMARMALLGLKPGSFRQRILVRAPISGKITEISVVAGEYRNDLTAPLMTIADLSTVWVAADVPESSIRHVNIGEAFEVRLAAYPGDLFHSRITRISDSVDPASRTIEVWAELKNPQGRLRPQMFGEVRHIHSLQKMPAVPATAVIQAQQRTIVYKELAAGKFQAVDVEVGKRTGDRMPVLKGLNPGDRVVVDGAMLLRGY